MTFDWIAAQEDMRQIRADNEVSLAMRRADGTVAAQPMRIEYAGARAFQLVSDAAKTADQALYILGEPDMDIQKDDRLTFEDATGRKILIKVVFVQMNRLAATIAEAIVEV